MDQLTPIYRIEFFLDAIVNNSSNDLEPIYRVEFFLARIAGRDVEIPQPLSRMEMFLAQLCGETVTLPTPQSRTEQYLAAICGEDVEIPPFPVYRIEYWLAAWAEGGSEIVTVTGIAPLSLLDAVAHPIHSLTQYGLCVQSGTPTPSAPMDIVCNNGALMVSLNLANMVSGNIVVGQYIDNTGTPRNDSANFFYAPLIPVDAAKTYTMHTSASLAYFSVMEYDSSRGFLKRDLFGTSSVAAGDTITFTLSADCAFIRFGSNIKKSAISEANVLAIDWMLTQTATAQEFRPYGEIYAGGTHPGKNLYNKADGVLNGYPSATGTWNGRSGDTSELSIIVTLEEGKTYTAQRADGANCPFRVMGSANRPLTNGQSLQVISAPSATTYNEKTFTVPSGYPHIVFYVRNNVGSTLTIDDVVNAFQVELGSIATAYEPYTEVPYLPEVLTVSGANLANMVAENIDVNKIIYDNGSVSNSANNFVYNAYIPVEAGQNYVLYGRRKSDNAISAYNRICWYDENKGWISRATYTQGTIGSAVAPNNAAYARFTVSPYNSSATLTLDDVLDFNWTFAKATEEIPYQPYVQPQTVGWKNLFDKNDYTEINAYVNANTGVLTAGSPGSMTQYCAVIPCEPNTQYNITGQSTSAWGAFTADSIGTTATATTKGGNLTTGPNDRYLIGLVRANGDSIDYRNTLVVRETVTDIPMLLGVGDYKDEGEIINGLLTHKIGIKVLNGTEDWLYSSGWSDTTHKCFYVELDTIKQQTAVTNECLCSHLEWYSRDSFYADKTIVGGCVSGYIPTDPESGRALTVRVSSSIAETANDLKAWLAAQYAAGTPVIVVYPLATETTEQTTPHALHTSAGTNVVDVTANVSPVELAVEYAKEAS